MPAPTAPAGRLWLLSAAALAGLLAAGPGVRAADAEFFEKKVRPVFAEHCYKCHSAAGKTKGGLRLDTVAGIRKGGETGPLFVPGKPKQSLLVTALRHEETAMPPDGKLPDAVVRDVAVWVEGGAVLPAEPSGGPAPRREAFRISPEDRDHWAFKPVVRPTVPAGPGRTDIDRFVLAKLAPAKLTPAPAADPYTLLRRVTYDLTGLPPTPEAIDTFLKDSALRTPHSALEAVVDRLLASPEFGAHWGRHWLDGVRYASDVDKSGRYREWVVRSVNADLPYDRFLAMQLAGDLLPPGTEDPAKLHTSGASLDGVAATGMLALAVWELVGRDLAVAEIVDSQIDVLGRQVLGLTLACARCHDHKFDPVSAEDYYGLAGVFFSSHISPGNLIADGRLSGEVVTAPLLSKADDTRNRKLDGQIAELAARLRAVPGAEKLEKLAAEVAKLDADHTAAKAGAAKTKLADQLAAKRKEADKATADLKASDPAGFAKVEDLRRQIAGLQKRKVIPPQAIVTREGGVPGSNREKIADAPVLLRGDFRREGPVVPRRFPVILAGENQPRVTTGSGRLELATWVTRPDHPLTPRVITNRVWLHLFGEGLVRTPDNFGRLGEKPTHPELLDHLAARFVAGGWSVKGLVREIVLSDAYRRASAGGPELAKADPANLLLGRMSRKRLSYEAVRDSLLAAGGQLAGPAGAPAATAVTRTMFGPVERRKGDEMRAVFDGPDPKEVVAGRADTTTAPQALFMMNNRLVLDAADRLAAEVTARPDLKTDADRVNHVYRRLVGRPPSARESDLARAFLARASWAEFLHVLLCTNEFVYVD